MQLNHAMMDDQRKNDRDLELFSELIEPPIHLHLVQVVPPFSWGKQPNVHNWNVWWSSLETESILLANLVLTTKLKT